MGRMVVCLGSGVLVWALLGAVRGAASWDVSATGYLLALLAAGAVFGLVWPGPHLLTGALLALPGAATLITSSPPDQPDAFWWLLTTVVGGYAAAGTHRLAVELRAHFAAPRRGR
ncbi:MAG: hypothetical protein ACRD2C_00770 [Acidimicrobiales bacterium]